MTLRIIVASDAPWSTSGYANQVGMFSPRLAQLGHEVAILCTYGLQGNTLDWQGLRVYPGGTDPFANDVIKVTAQDWQADIVITLKDSFVFNPAAFEGVRWVPMIPFDHEPAPPEVINRARVAYRPIAYAPNGFRAMRAAGLDPLYAPHGYDPAVFHPEPQEDARKFLGLPSDLFIVGTVAVNRGGIPSRKAWPENLEGFARFAKDKPDARYYLHTRLGQDGREGAVNIPHVCTLLSEELGYDVLSRIIFCDQARYDAPGGFPPNYLLAYYNAIDVLNAVSLGEGFGIPQLEAQACATPVIGSDFAAARDLVLGGWKVKEGLRFYDSQGARVFLPSPGAIAQTLEKAYRARTNPHMWAEKKREAIVGAKGYEIGHVVDTYWKPALEELEAQIAGEMSRGVLRIVRREEVGV